MSINPSDIQWSVVPETVFGTTPATPAFLILDYTDVSVSPESDWLESKTIKKDRGSSGGRRAKLTVTGSAKMELCRDAGLDLLFASGLSGTWATNVLKGGATDSSFTLEKKMGSLYQRFTGCMVKSVSIDGAAEDFFNVTYEIIGTAETHTEAALSGATYANASTSPKLTGTDMALVLAGLSVDYTKFSLKVEFNRSQNYAFGSSTPVSLGTQDNRKVSGSFEFFREDWTPNDVLTDAGIALTATIGTGADGLQIEVPAAQCKFPKDQNSGSSVMVSVDFMGKDTAADGTNVIITKLS